jgi:diguanylate cyclase (GGDEF)-like protein
LVLQDLAYRDGLTGLPNRRFFHWYLEQYLPRQAIKRPLDRKMTSVVLLDLNGFKAINDTYGHDAGDELLKHLSDTFGADLPTDVLIARLGGDEFVAMVRDSENSKKLASVVKVIRKASKSPLIYQGNRIQVSASVGVASTHRRRPVLGELLREADKKMYEDKAALRQLRETAPLRAMLNAEMEM